MQNGSVINTYPRLNLSKTLGQAVSAPHSAHAATLEPAPRRSPPSLSLPLPLSLTLSPLDHASAIFEPTSLSLCGSLLWLFPCLSLTLSGHLWRESCTTCGDASRDTRKQSKKQSERERETVRGRGKVGREKADLWRIELDERRVLKAAAFSCQSPERARTARGVTDGGGGGERERERPFPATHLRRIV